MKIKSGNIGLQSFHNLYHTMFQCIVCLESHNDWIFKDTNHTLLHVMASLWYSCMPYFWTVNDYHAAERHHVWLSICFLFLFAWWSTWSVFIWYETTAKTSSDILLLRYRFFRNVPFCSITDFKVAKWGQSLKNWFINRQQK